MEEAQNLFIRKQLGRGSKWLTRIVLLFLLIGMLLALYFKLGQIFPARELPFVFTLVLAGCVGFVFWRRLNRKRRGVAQIEMSENGVTFLGPDSRTNAPWTAFGDLVESPLVFALSDRQKGIVFTFPKRAFPDEASRNWFRALAKARPASQNAVPAETPPETATADQLVIKFQLRFRDYIDRSLNSCFVWGAILAALGVFIGSYVHALLYPSPDAVNSSTKVFMIMLPFMALMVIGMILLASFVHWRQHKKYLTEQQVILSGKSIRMISGDADGTLPWSAYPRYKKTRRNFILWNPRSRAWVMLPKRAFASKDEIERCRMLLASNSRPSRWYFG
jgi:ABC-type transport system involved in cytochrome c biogenesis permease subunit